MLKLIALKLSLLLLITTLTPLGSLSSVHAQVKSPTTCENGECIQRLLDRLQDLSAVYQKQCLPTEGMKPSQIEKHHKENGFTEGCWKLITEINHLDDELQKHQVKLEQKLGCVGGDCRFAPVQESIHSQLSVLSKVEQNLSCTEPKKEEIRSQCSTDIGCALASSALGFSGYLYEMLSTKPALIKECHMGDDSCATQFVTSFLNAAVEFFKGSWEVLKFAGRKGGEVFISFWDWVRGAEDHTATSQLALAKASEDPGLFDMLKSDFPGTVKKLLTALVAAMKEWMKTDILCQKWEGTPHFSKCLAPTDSFECVSCKALVNGFCGISGTILSEVIPAFLTGGIVTALKEGQRGAAKIARLFTVSGPARTSLKNSRAARLAAETATKVDVVLRASRGLQLAKVAIQTSLRAIRTYLLTPTRIALKNSYAVLAKAARTGSLYVAETKAGRILVVSEKMVKNTGKVLLYPVNNPATALAFKAGQRTFAKALKVGAGKVVINSASVSAVAKGDKTFESILLKLEEARLKPNATDELLKAETELVTKIGSRRDDLTTKALSQTDANISEIISVLYPELKYGAFARSLPPDKILAAERQLQAAIEKLPQGKQKTALQEQFEAHVAEGVARTRVISPDADTNLRH